MSKGSESVYWASQTLSGTFDPGADADFLLGVLAWTASAAGVGGTIIVGMQLALQLHRGLPGEGGNYFRGLFFVLGGCILATTAGPIVSFLGPFSI
ncbi:hypothetical protein [Streptomyces chartreusis]|uniref:hypothetical protein n=1 Tax=Streptomyces chartreusis TaxID=1969 RepID=UPI00368A401B